MHTSGKSAATASKKKKKKANPPPGVPVGATHPPFQPPAFPTQQEQTVRRATYWIGSHAAVTYTLNLYVTDGGISVWLI